MIKTDDDLEQMPQPTNTRQGNPNSLKRSNKHYFGCSKKKKKKNLHFSRRESGHGFN